MRYFIAYDGGRLACVTESKRALKYVALDLLFGNIVWTTSFRAAQKAEKDMAVGSLLMEAKEVPEEEFRHLVRVNHITLGEPV